MTTRATRTPARAKALRTKEARARGRGGGSADENTSQHTADQQSRDARDAASEKSVSKRRRAIFKLVDTGRVLIN